MASKLGMVALVLVAALGGLGLTGCTTDDLEDDEGPVWTDGKADGEVALAYRTIVSAAQFEALALKDGGVVIQGPSMKFVIDRRKPSSPKIYFQNANFKAGGKTPESARYHYYFADAVLSGRRSMASSSIRRTWRRRERSSPR
jgi:hypothetical protein